MSQRILNIAAIVDISTAYGRDVLRGLGKFANQQGHWSIYPIAAWSYQAGDPLFGIDGVIVQASRLEVAQGLRECNKPAVNVADNHPDNPLPTVRSDHQEIGHLAARHLLDRGFKNLAFCGVRHEFYAEQRALGFLQTIESFGITTREFWANTQGESDAQDRSVLDPWMPTLSRPVGIMACNDGWARAAARACRRLGLRVPEDVAVIGVDNDDLICELYDPQLSSVAVAVQRIGYEAAALLTRLLQGQPAPSDPIVVPPIGVVTRQSSDIMAIQDRLVVAALQFVREHAGEPISVQDVVEYVGVSRRRLETHFSSMLGRTPAAGIRRVRIERAKHLLETTDVALSTIAFDCGFSDAPRLTKVFSKELNMTPSTYRMRTRLR